MSSAPLAPIALELVVLIVGIVLLLLESFAKGPDRTWVAKTGLFALLVAFGWSFHTTGDAGVDPSKAFYVADPLALFFKRIALASTIIVLIMAQEYKATVRRFIPGVEGDSGLAEFYALPVLACAGLMFMASATDFIMIFVSLELSTIAFYVLVAYMRRNVASLEAGVKYLILGALSTGFLVYGITWVFGATGETNLYRIAAKAATLGPDAQPALLFGAVLLLIALGFKIAAAPFQLWVPDVYQGAPTPVTAFLSVASKAAGFIVLIRVVEALSTAHLVGEKISLILTVLAALSLIYGNFAALPQDNFKRLLAYSSIAHAGYLLIAVASHNTSDTIANSTNAVAFYLGGYLLMTMLAFLVMTVVSNHSRGDDIRDFYGLGKRSPFLAVALLVALASLAGIPLTVGFIGKWLVFASGIAAKKYLLVGIGIAAVVAGFYYYLRVAAAMFWQEPTNDTPIHATGLTKLTLAALTALVLLLGVYPQPILRMIGTAPAPHATHATR